MHLFATYNVNNDIQHRIDDIRGHPHSTYAQRRRGGVKSEAYDCVRGRGGEGFKVVQVRKTNFFWTAKPQNFSFF